MATPKEGKLVHLSHIDELIWEQGFQGVKSSIAFLESVTKMLTGHTESKVSVTTKWDGAPSLVCGINPDNHRFFVATKGAFANTPKLNYTPQDIDKNHPNPGLNSKLKIALQYLPQIRIKNVLQGDMLYTKSDLSIKDIDGVSHILFQPNTIVYAIPEASQLGRRILQSQLGIVFHTSYEGSTFASLKAAHGSTIPISSLSLSKDIWFRDATFVDVSGTATFTANESLHILQMITELKALGSELSPAILNRIATNETIRIQIQTYYNSKVRAGTEVGNPEEHISGLIQWVTAKLNKDILESKKQDTRRKRELEKKEVLGFYGMARKVLVKALIFQNEVVRIKTEIIRKLESAKEIGTFLRDSEGLKVTNPEGFCAVDHKGNIVKLVDRLTFSHANFTAAKNWVKK